MILANTPRKVPGRDGPAVRGQGLAELKAGPGISREVMEQQRDNYKAELAAQVAIKREREARIQTSFLLFPTRIPNIFVAFKTLTLQTYLLRSKL